MKNLFNGSVLWILFVLGCGNETNFTPPPALPSPSTSRSKLLSPSLGFASGKCQAKQGNSLGAVVCQGEDWWLPSYVPNSTQGIVHVGYGYRKEVDSTHTLKDKPFQEDTTGQAFMTTWKGEEDSLGQSLTSILYKYVEEDCIKSCRDQGGSYSDCTSIDSSGFWDRTVTTYLCKEPFRSTFVRKNLYLTMTKSPVNGSNAPLRLNTDLGIPFAKDVVNSWASTRGSTSSLSYFSNFLDDLNLSAFDHTYAWWYQANGTYPFYDAQFLFLSQLGDKLNQYDVFGQVKMMNLNAESGWLPFYVAWGMLTFADIDNLANRLVGDALLLHSQSKIDKSKWLVNIAMGGRAFKRWGELAAVHGMGIGMHGPLFFNYRFLQHLPHLQYNSSTYTYEKIGANPFSNIHIDTEILDLTTNTWGQYRLFRFSVTSAIALGINSFILTSSAIPSQGAYQDPTVTGNKCMSLGVASAGNETRPCNFDWSAIQSEGAMELVQWMNKNVGTTDTTAPEAFCVLSQLGQKVPDGIDFSSYMQTQKKNDPSWSFMTASNPWMLAPRVHYFGKSCDLLSIQTTSYEGRTLPGRKMDTSLLGVTSPATDNVAYSGQSNSGVYAYEGRTTQPIFATMGGKKGALLFRIADSFFKTHNGTWVVKVMFSAPMTPENTSQEGKWSLHYRSTQGWKSAGQVSFSATQLNVFGKPALQTATFQLKDAAFLLNAFENSDIAIVHDSGIHATFTMLRFIRWNSPSL